MHTPGLRTRDSFPPDDPKGDALALEASGSVRVDLATASELASSIGAVLDELRTAYRVLQHREAELAAGVPVVPQQQSAGHLSMRMEHLLRGLTELVDASAAGVYLLDEATSHLKLRAAWGLPPGRLAEPPHALEGALADLEALLGHAVVVDDVARMPQWRVPESCRAAACVPISSPTTLLGTLWVFDDHQRGFDDRQTQLMEIVAGRIAAELEREMLLVEALEGSRIKQQLFAGERLQRGMLPTTAALPEGWQAAVWNEQAYAVGGDFYDWFLRPDGKMAFVTGHAMETGIEAALCSAAIRSAVRSHAQGNLEPDRLLAAVHFTLWTASAGDQEASLFCGVVEPSQGSIRFATAGRMAVLTRHAGRWQPTLYDGPPLGAALDRPFAAVETISAPADAILLATPGVLDTRDRNGQPFGHRRLAEAASAAGTSADAILRAAHGALLRHAADGMRADRTILVLTGPTLDVP